VTLEAVQEIGAYFSISVLSDSKRVQRAYGPTRPPCCCSRIAPLVQSLCFGWEGCCQNSVGSYPRGLHLASGLNSKVPQAEQAVRRQQVAVGAFNIHHFPVSLWPQTLTLAFPTSVQSEQVLLAALVKSTTVEQTTSPSKSLPCSEVLRSLRHYSEVCWLGSFGQESCRHHLLELSLYSSLPSFAPTRVLSLSLLWEAPKLRSVASQEACLRGLSAV